MRNCPIPASPIHITYRLYGSIPNLGLSKLHENHRLQKVHLQEKYPIAIQATDVATRNAFHGELIASEQQAYLAFDGILDLARTGPRYLAGPEEKNIILDSWKFIAGRLGYRIFAISVMSNHVHVLLENGGDSQATLEQVMRQHKRFTAMQINRLHKTPGRRVWAEREYSRTVRHGNFERTLWYVLDNPVKAGLTEEPETWFGNYYPDEVRANFMVIRSQAG